MTEKPLGLQLIIVLLYILAVLFLFFILGTWFGVGVGEVDATNAALQSAVFFLLSAGFVAAATGLSFDKNWAFYFSVVLSLGVSALYFPVFLGGFEHPIMLGMRAGIMFCFVAPAIYLIQWRWRKRLTQKRSS